MVDQAAETDAIAKFLCAWWESDESDAHADDGTPFPCRLCAEQAAALVLHVQAGHLPGLMSTPPGSEKRRG